MEFGKQYFDVYTTWAERQMKVGQDFFEALQGADKFDPSLMWDKTLEAYQASIQGTLDAEVAGAHLLFEDMAGLDYLPQEAIQLVDRSKEVAEQVTNVQQTVVDNGFEFLRKFDAKRLALEIPQV